MLLGEVFTYAFAKSLVILTSAISAPERNFCEIGTVLLLAVAALVVSTSTFTIFFVTSIIGAFWLIIAAVGRTSLLFAGTYTEIR